MFTGGLFLFLFIFLMAFWLLLFLGAFALPYSITLWAINKFKPKTEKSDDEAS
jgi:hypothetical protein